MVDRFAAFLGVAALVIVTPGPDTALTIRNTLFGGRRGGVFTALGVSSGQATWALGASAGMPALLQASPLAFMTVRIVGATYLAFLGAQALRTSQPTDPAPAEGPPPPRVAPPMALRQGFISNLTNPKMAVFFTGLLPQFTPRGSGSFSASILFGIVFAGMTLLWLTCYVLAVARVGDLLRRPGVRRTLEALTGGAMLALAVRLALEVA